MPYKFDLLNLMPGDILLARGGSFKSKIISNVTAGNFSHAMIYVGGTIIHADSGGVYSKNPQRIYADNKDDLAVYRMKESISEEDIKKICATARAEVGKLYDKKGAVSSIIPGLDRSRDDRQFCSKLVALAFDSVQISFGKPIEKITPNDFCRSDLLEKKDLIIPMSEGDIIFAESPDYNFDLQQETFQWLSEARSFAKKRNYTIGSINDVLEYLIEFPEDDADLCEIIDRSRYFGFLNIDKEKNPYRYDFDDFKKFLSEIEGEKKIDFIRNEYVGLESESLISRRDNYFWSVFLLAERNLLFFRKNHELHKSLYFDSMTRIHVLNLINDYIKFLNDREEQQRATKEPDSIYS